MPAIDLEVLWHQVLALVQNLQTWVVRSVLRVPAPALLPPGSDAQSCAQPDAVRCTFVEILGPGGVDQLRARSGCWAICGYNLMKEFNGSQRIPIPIDASALPPDAVVVENRAFSVNYADICIRWGLYESALKFVGWPIVPGFDIAGTVGVAGSESGFAPGDRVFGCSLFGSYASRVVVPKRQLLHAPERLSFETLASLPAVAATALHACHLAGLWPAEARLGGPLAGASRSEHCDALVHSAAGGVGDMLCQILHLCGARVVGIVGSSSKVSECKADVVLDKSKLGKGWSAAARAHAPEGFRAAFDANGVATLSQSYDLLARNGRLIVYGFHSNLPKSDGGLGQLSPLSMARMALDLLRTPRFDPMDMTLGSKAVLGFNLSFFAEEKELCQQYLQQLGSWISEGRLLAPAVRSFPFAQVREAHNALTSGRTVGKMVVVL